MPAESMISVYASPPNLMPADVHNLLFVTLVCSLFVWAAKLVRQSLIAAELRGGLRRDRIHWADRILLTVPDIGFLRKRCGGDQARAHGSERPAHGLRMGVGRGGARRP